MSGKAMKAIILEIILWLFAIVYLFPIYLILSAAFKTPSEFMKNNFGLPLKPVLDNFYVAWTTMKIPLPFINSIILVLFGIGLTVIVASLASYAISRKSSGLYHAFYIFFLAGLMIPFQLTMIPLYKIVRNLHLMNTKTGVILIYAAMGCSFAILILTEFIKGIPRELDESAVIDGCNKFLIYRKIILPLLKPAIATIIALNSVTIWNDLLLPYLFLGSNKSNFTVTTALFSFQSREFVTEWNNIFAGSTLAFIPVVILFLFLQKYFISGMVAGSLKG